MVPPPSLPRRSPPLGIQHHPRFPPRRRPPRRRLQQFQPRLHAHPPPHHPLRKILQGIPHQDPDTPGGPPRLRLVTRPGHRRATHVSRAHHLHVRHPTVAPPTPRTPPAQSLASFLLRPISPPMSPQRPRAKLPSPRFVQNTEMGKLGFIARPTNTRRQKPIVCPTSIY